MMILLAMAVLVAQPAAAPPASAAAELTRILDAVPEASRAAGKDGEVVLPPPTAAWLDRLPDTQARDVALLVLLSYRVPVTQRHASDAMNWTTGLAFLAAEVAQNNEPSRYERDYSINSPVPMRAPAGDLRDVRAARAARALAWGKKLGLCEAAFVDTLRALPPPVASGDPDLRQVVHDLGMLAYTPENCTAVASR